MDIVASEDLDRMRELTERYARYSRSAGGLSLIVGGVLAVIAFLVGTFVPLTPGLRWLLAATPLFWLASKELLRALYYQRHGGVGERLSPQLQRLHRWMVVYLFVVSAVVVGGVLALGDAGDFGAAKIGYLLLVIALPLAAMRWFWSVGDFYVGVLLFCQAAVVFAGGNYGGAWLFFTAACASIAVLTGVREHREFLRIREQLHGHGAR